VEIESFKNKCILTNVMILYAKRIRMIVNKKIGGENTFSQLFVCKISDKKTAYDEERLYIIIF